MYRNPKSGSVARFSISRKSFSDPAAAPNSSAKALASRELVTRPIQSELLLILIAL